MTSHRGGNKPPEGAAGAQPGRGSLAQPKGPRRAAEEPGTAGARPGQGEGTGDRDQTVQAGAMKAGRGGTGEGAVDNGASRSQMCPPPPPSPAPRPAPARSREGGDKIGPESVTAPLPAAARRCRGGRAGAGGFSGPVLVAPAVCPHGLDVVGMGLVRGPRWPPLQPDPAHCDALPAVLRPSCCGPVGTSAGHGDPRVPPALRAPAAGRAVTPPPLRHWRGRRGRCVRSGGPRRPAKGPGAAASWVGPALWGLGASGPGPGAVRGPWTGGTTPCTPLGRVSTRPAGLA